MPRYAPHPRSPLSNGYSTAGRVRARPSRTAEHHTKLMPTRLGFRQRGIGQAPPGTTVDNIAALLERTTGDYIKWQTLNSRLGWPGWAQEITRVRNYLAAKLSWLRVYVDKTASAYADDAFITALSTAYDMALWQQMVNRTGALVASTEFDWREDLPAYIRLHSTQMGWIDGFITELRAKHPALIPQPGSEQEIPGADEAASGSTTATYIGLAVAGYGAYSYSPGTILSGVLVMALGGLAGRFGV